MLKDRLPAYISWERFQRNLRQLEANMTQNQEPSAEAPPYYLV